LGTKHVAAVSLCLGLGIAGVVQLFGNGGAIGWLLAGFLLLAARFLAAPRPGELALAGKCFAALLALIAVLVAGLFVAWESAEVVVLRHRDEQGRPVEARLWVVDLGTDAIVATGSAKRRVAQIRARPEVELVRGGRSECRRAAVIEESGASQQQRRALERLFEEKYGVRLQATRLLAWFFGAPPGEQPVAIRLEPCSR
jgi:hypothetical protein